MLFTAPLRMAIHTAHLCVLPVLLELAVQYCLLLPNLSQLPAELCHHLLLRLHLSMQWREGGREGREGGLELKARHALAVCYICMYM